MLKKPESNFKKAVNELLGYSSESDDELELPDFKEEPQPAAKSEPVAAEIPSQPQEPASPVTPAPAPAPARSSVFGAFRSANPLSNSNPMRMTAETSKVSSYTTVETKTLSMDTVGQVTAKVAVITEDTIINGDISTQSDLNIYGQVTGSVVCRGDILVLGRVTGDVSGVNVRVEGEVNGNMTVDKRADVGANGRIKGDITAANVSSEGISEGDIKAEETIHLGGNAIVIGKVYAKAFAIIQGAKIKGMMTTYD